MEIFFFLVDKNYIVFLTHMFFLLLSATLFGGTFRNWISWVKSIIFDLREQKRFLQKVIFSFEVSLWSNEYHKALFATKMKKSKKLGKMKLKILTLECSRKPWKNKSAFCFRQDWIHRFGLEFLPQIQLFLLPSCFIIALLYLECNS